MCNASVFKFHRLEERFQRAPFRNGLVKTVALTIEIKLGFKFLQHTDDDVHGDDDA